MPDLWSYFSGFDDCGIYQYTNNKYRTKDAGYECTRKRIPTLKNATKRPGHEMGLIGGDGGEIGK